MIRVAAITKHEGFLKALEQFLQQHEITLLSVISSFGGVMNKLKLLAPHVVLLDVNLDSHPFNYGFIEVSKLIRSDLPGTRVVAFTNFYSASVVNEVKRLPLDGFIYRTMPNVENCLVECIRSTYNGSVFYATETFEYCKDPE